MYVSRTIPRAVGDKSHCAKTGNKPEGRGKRRRPWKVWRKIVEKERAQIGFNRKTQETKCQRQTCLETGFLRGENCWEKLYIRKEVTNISKYVFNSISFFMSFTSGSEA